MKYSVSLYTIAILAGSIHSAFGLFDFPDFVGGTQNLINDINNARANFKAIKLNGDLQTPVWATPDLRYYIGRYSSTDFSRHS